MNLFIESLRDNHFLKFLVSMILTVAIILMRKAFLFCIPLLPYSGLWAYSRFNPREVMYQSSYVEFGLCLYFLAKIPWRKMDRMTGYLLLLPLLCLPSFANAHGHAVLSLFLFFCLLGGAGIYAHYRKVMEWMIAVKLVDKTVMLWLVMGVLIKIYTGLLLHESILTQRGGGVIGSNHLAGVMLLLLPYIATPWLTLLTLGFLCLQFSRGIYLALAVYMLAWGFFINMRRTLTVAAASLALVAGFMLILSSRDLGVGVGRRKITVVGFLKTRLRTSSTWGSEQAVSAAKSDERWKLQGIAIETAKDNHFLGEGLGGFSWALDSIEYPLEYSNAHNMYLTCLAEGGLFFFVGFVLLLGYLLLLSFRFHPATFAGLFSWIIYGCYSGEIYEVGGMATAGDYYNLMFMLAFLMHAVSRQRALRRVETGISARLSSSRS